MANAERSFLEESGFSVREARDGPAAVSLADPQHFDLALMEVDLGPGISGIEAARRIRGISSDRPGYHRRAGQDGENQQASGGPGTPATRNSPSGENDLSLVQSLLSLQVPESDTPSNRDALRKAGDRLGIITCILDSRFTRNATHMSVFLEDNGLGFPEEVMLHRKFGFGLSVVESLISQYNGSLEISNQPGGKVVILLDLE